MGYVADSLFGKRKEKVRDGFPGVADRDDGSNWTHSGKLRIMSFLRKIPGVTFIASLVSENIDFVELFLP